MMKKYFAILLCVSCSASAVIAAAPIQLRCISSMPTTSFIVDTQNETVKMNLIHHNGSKYMPIFTGTITPSDFSFLQEKAALLTQIPENITVEWKREDCRTEETGIFECDRGGTLQLGSLKVSSPALSTFRTTRKSLSGKVERMNVRFSFVAYQGSFGYVHDIQMDYKTEDCQF